MGGHMLNNLLKNKISVVVYDISEDAVTKAVDAGAKKAESPSEVASLAKTIITMLPSSPHVKEVYLGQNGILSKAQPDSLFVDSSTIDPDVSRQLEKEALKFHSTFIDAPVSGGVTAAKEGTLTFMVGGQQSSFSVVKDLLENMGKIVVYCGPSGTGQAAKICNNMLLGISMIGTAEAMILGQKLGLDPKLFASILNSSSGQCWSTLKYNPCPGVVENIPASRNYEGGFGSKLMAKDLGLAQTSAMLTSTPTPLGSLAHHMYRMLCNSGYAEKDFASIYLFLQGIGKAS
ncbi:hypothetical protein HELRODRAFT_156397 [Helobdella robusta]|uniref:3-hydroxyisobutyrate dehydrogenase n=1 Tax=Helobdella robusta TaxID=6412 RepID=T1ELV5_HELRO|nr:hypothetical protein HELRODRAFT_156397 [Helobdella robusta]ESO10157.1 hypothetical protein HELRODRAFT_156397 [Helobdella robusta]